MTITERANQLSAQIEPSGGHRHHPAFNGTSEIRKLISDLTERTTAGALPGNTEAETLAAEAHAQLDVARNGIAGASNQLDYPAIFAAIATAEEKTDALETLAGG